MPLIKHELEKAVFSTQSQSMCADNFELEVDHISIFAAQGWRGVAVLQEFGFYCYGQTVQRVEQGTASTIIFFENSYLELISIEDENAVKQYVTRTGIDILARAHSEQTGASPFGLSLRNKSDIVELMQQDETSTEEMRSNTPIHFAADNVANVAEPLCFVIPDSLALTSWLDSSREAHQRLTTHPLGVKELTGIRIIVNSDKKLSAAATLLSHMGIVDSKRGTAPLLELTFDHGKNGKIIDARPMLPILLKH